MSEVSLEKLRKLRARAERILTYAGKDLFEFRNADGLTFVRTPTSPKNPDDVNVTTTCSCLMALSLTDQIAVVYNKPREEVLRAFRKLVDAHWMSSGLTENNPFTTALVIRTLGFLIEQEHLAKDIATESNLKAWEIGLGVDDRVDELVNQLISHSSAMMDLIWRSLSDAARGQLEVWNAGGKDPLRKRNLVRLLSLEIQRVIEGSWIYTKDRFPKISSALQEQRDKINFMYDRAAFNRALLAELEPIFQLRRRSLVDIARLISRDVENFTINEYPPSGAVLYWFVDGVTRANITLDAKNWKGLCDWGAGEFYHQRSLFVAQHQAMMDPVAMAMAACLCARIKKRGADLGAASSDLQKLPTDIELEASVRELFGEQSNGIWPKYFPLFHYQEAGSNFCFTFELLEGILVEFGGKDGSLLDDVAIVDGLSQSVDWCDKNLLRSRNNGCDYTGWNSGGSLETLRKGQPESWATAVVHMFLSVLVTRLSERIQQKILQTYRTIQPKRTLSSVENGHGKKTALERLLDIDLLLPGEDKGLREILTTEFVTRHADLNEALLRRKKVEPPLSALLFGPPGTSKTQVVKSIAADLKWPLILIDPSEFLKGTFANIYARADEIFRDLMDLSAVVVFFDEMDALTQRRDSETHLDTETQFLTTCMLPKLSDLHDNGKVIFFVATNFQQNFDPAIKRAGRFDFLLCMGPPKLDEKVEHLFAFFDLEEDNPQTQKAQLQLQSYLDQSPPAANQLALYTFGEFKSFIKSIGSASTIGNNIETLGKEGFVAAVAAFTRGVTLRGTDVGKKNGISLEELDSLTQRKLSKAKKTDIGRYAIDRKASRRQC